MKKFVVFSLTLSIACMVVITEANFFGDYDSVDPRGSSGSHHQTISFFGDQNSYQQRPYYNTFGGDDDSFQNIRVGGSGHGRSFGGRKRGGHGKSESSKTNEHETLKKNDDESFKKYEDDDLESFKKYEEDIFPKVRENKELTKPSNEFLSREEKQRLEAERLRKLNEPKEIEELMKKVDELFTTRKKEVEQIIELNTEMRGIFAQKLWNERKLKREQKRKLEEKKDEEKN